MKSTSAVIRRQRSVTQSVTSAFCSTLLLYACCFSVPALAEEDDDDVLDYTAAIFGVAQKYDSEFVSQSVPTGMDWGSWYQVTVAFKNKGPATWSPGVVRLVNAGSSDFGTAEVPLTYEVGVGGTASFTFGIKSECNSWSSVLVIPVCTQSQPSFTWMMAGPTGTFGPASPVLSNLIGSSGGSQQPLPPSGSKGLPRPAVPLIDQIIPGSPPPAGVPNLGSWVPTIPF